MANNPRKGRSDRKSGKFTGRKEAFKDKNFSKEEKIIKSNHNDPNWYIRNPQTVQDVGCYSFNTGLGYPVPFTSNSGYTNYTSVIPGIMNLYNGPSVGVSGGALVATAPINTAATNIYSWVRHANSGHSNYDQQDLMMYLMAMDSIYTFHSWCVRLLGYLSIYSYVNKYVGAAMITSNGVSVSDLTANIANFRGWVNRFAEAFASLAVPDTMSFMDRHIWMYSNIYKDEDVGKCQYYQYVPAYLYKFMLDDQGAGMLQATGLCCRVTSSGTKINPVSNMTVAQIEAYGNALLNAVQSEEDFGIMSGDILKAFGAERLLHPLLVGDMYSIEPVFREEVLIQIHNSDFAGLYPLKLDYEGNETISLETMNITQTTGINAGYIVCNPIFRDATNLSYSHIFDSWKEAVPPEDVIEGTRNMITGYVMLGSNRTYLTSTGSDICLFANIWKYASDGTLSQHTTHNTYDGVWSDALVFNEYPIFRGVDSNGNMNSLLGEINNYTTMNDEDIIALHNTALQAQFGVPYFK